MAKVRFRTNILLKSIIGKDLITDDNVAVLELVKNCFDSGSNNAKIIFRDIISNLSLRDYKKSNSSKIIIRDGPCPHYRVGHFRYLSSERFRVKRGMTVFVHGAFVKGKAKTVLSPEDTERQTP